MSLVDALTDLKGKLNTETRVSEWLVVSQDMISQFGTVTKDEQWIHMDVERAGALTPFGGTIAHGFLTLSLIPYLTGGADMEKPIYPGVVMGINYGLNKVRFPNVVASGSRVRARMTLLGVHEVKGNGLQIVNQVTIEIEGQEKPGCVAETVSRLYFG